MSSLLVSLCYQLDGPVTCLCRRSAPVPRCAASAPVAMAATLFSEAVGLRLSLSLMDAVAHGGRGRFRAVGCGDVSLQLLLTAKGDPWSCCFRVPTAVELSLTVWLSTRPALNVTRS
ncbi:hypothetical protein AAFF_G00224950 [Aldrovandia affinis]|uniref:Uncharacterized protein n=1 Tax=Aldrovandia affinis TaxID=143900 RepID=A0AAD7TBM7_9TELE|nr:hypothetical protein AAFF_G00224950 [Aldrovandia affinis]